MLDRIIALHTIYREITDDDRTRKNFEKQQRKMAVEVTRTRDLRFGGDNSPFIIFQ